MTETKIGTATVRFTESITTANDVPVRIHDNWIEVTRESGKYWYPRDVVKHVKRSENE